MFADSEWSQRIPQLVHYHHLLDVVHAEGMQAFVCLTHLDVYRAQQSAAIAATKALLTEPEDAGAGRLGEDILFHLKGVYLQLSQK
jgi:hypothetical protein